MTEAIDQDTDRRVLLLAPTSRDAEITRLLLTQAGLSCFICNDVFHLAGEMQKGAGAILLTEDAIVSDGIEELLAAMSRQPSWSDIPVVILMHGGVQSPAAIHVLRSLRNPTLLERPAPTRSVVSATQAAVRARQRQYQIRDQIEQLRVAAQERAGLLASEHAARIEADRANRMKDEFLATLSHELRTPLNAILGWVQLLQRARDAETLGEGLAVIERNARVQTQLIEDLLDMSRIISGKVKLDMQRVEPTLVIRAAMDAVRPSADAKGVTLKEDSDRQVPAITGDPARLQQIIWNLLSNAVKFTPVGGSIEVRSRRAGAQIEISVSDTGDGIEGEFLPHVFERFRQANAATTRRYGGLGIGLSIVKHLAEMHGGSVTAQSDGKGRGAIFTLTLPIPPPDEPKIPPHRPAQAEESAEIQLRGLTVLVVDDEPDARRLVKRVLEEYDANVVTAESSAAALETLVNLAPDVIVSDIGMPEQDGCEFLRLARIQGVKAPAVALTAFARVEDRLRSLRAGFQMHLSKPVEATELIAAVASTAGRLGGA
jgi:signal transduction histidine kinase/ActR/RegA family two-component response regulator